MNAGVFFWLGKPDVPNGFHKPFLVSATRIWAYLNGVFAAFAWAVLIFRPFTGWVALGLSLLVLSLWANHRESQWAQAVKDQL